jgi:MFS family permease
MKARIAQATLVAAVSIVNELARQSIFSLIVPMSKELKLNDTQQAQLLFAYFAGTFWMQVPSGMLAQRLGGCRTYTCMMVLLTLSFFGIPLAADFSFDHVWAALFLVGFVASPTTPASGIILNTWFPREERSSAVAIRELGRFSGGIISLLLSPWLAENFGWRAPYVIYGLISFCCLLLWATFSADDPNSCSYITREEQKFLASIHRKTTSASSSSWKSTVRLFSFSSVWSVIIAHATYNYVRAVWAFTPTYFQESLGTTAQQAGIYLAMVDVFALVGRPLVAWCDKHLQKHGHSLLYSRKFFTVGGFLFQAALLSSVTYWQSPLALALVLGLSSLGGAMHTGGYLANYLDQTTELQGTLGGVGNMVATLPGLFTGRFVTYLRHSHCEGSAAECLRSAASWASSWNSVVFCEIIAAGLFLRCASCTNRDVVISEKKAE